MNPYLERPIIDLMLIREFSHRSGLSSKALRLYNAVGLLEPHFVDPENGYRYYAPDQLERIALLRQLKMPPQRIVLLLEQRGDEAASSLHRYWQEVEALHRDKRSLVQYLVQVWQAKELPMFEISSRSVPEQKILTVHWIARAN